MTGTILAALLAALAAGPTGPAPAPNDTIVIPPLPYVEFVRAPSVPVSLFCTPAGTGSAFAAAQAFGGATVDATLEIILWSDTPGWGEPIANYPRQDIWLAASDGGLVPCAGGLIPDADTDGQGRTTWTLPLRTGGRLDRGAGARLEVWVIGDPVGGLPDVPLNVVSADLGGDGRVNLSDAGLFSQDLFGAYAYRSDFVWDGVINLSDAGRMAQAMGGQCP